MTTDALIALARRIREAESDAVGALVVAHAINAEWQDGFAQAQTTYRKGMDDMMAAVRGEAPHSHVFATPTMPLTCNSCGDAADEACVELGCKLGRCRVCREDTRARYAAPDGDEHSERSCGKGR